VLKRLTLSLKREEALRASRVSVGDQKLVYLLVTDKRLNYSKGRSRIAYIGTTKNGVNRIAQSVAARAPDILRLHGVHTFHARVVTCRPRQRVKTWLKLERALILAFRDHFGEVPKCNSHGKKISHADEFDRYFSRSRVSRIIDDLS
jgi:hypothetical protein